jgi:hypothetical protein
LDNLKRVEWHLVKEPGVADERNERDGHEYEDEDEDRDFDKENEEDDHSESGDEGLRDEWGIDEDRGGNPRANCGGEEDEDEDEDKDETLHLEATSEHSTPEEQRK